MARSSWMVLVAVCLAGCASASVEAIVSVTTEASGGVAYRAAPAGGTARVPLTLQSGERLSFTPSSLRIVLRGLYLCEQVVYRASVGGSTCGEDQTQIDVTSAPQSVELIGQPALGGLLSFSADVGSGEFGSYRGALLLWGSESESDLTVSGTISRGTDETLSFTDAVVPMGTGGVGINMVQAVELHEGTTGVVKFFFDVDATAFVSTANMSPQSTTLPDGTVLTIENPIFLPFVGSDEPQVRRFHVVLESDKFGDRSTWYLKVVSLADADGALVSMAWQTVFLDGFYVPSGPFEPGMLTNAKISPSGAGYRVEEDAELSFTLVERRLTFPEFRLETHGGSLLYGGVEYGYTATLQSE